MDKNLIGTQTVTQVGIIVRNIEETSKKVAALFGVETPEWFLTGDYEEAQTQYRGKPSEARAKLAFFHCGQVDIELIEPDGKPSTWQEFLDEHGEGVHHIAFVVNGMKMVVNALEQAGFPLVQKGEYEGGRYAYVDTTDSLKTVIELLEND